MRIDTHFLFIYEYLISYKLKVRLKLNSESKCDVITLTFVTDFEMSCFWKEVSSPNCTSTACIVYINKTVLNCVYIIFT